MTLEDTVLPRTYGDGKTTLLSLDEGLGKVRAGLAARDDPGFCIVARTGAVSVNGLDDAVERTRAYTASGADALFYTGIRTRAELDAIAAVATLPIILGGVEGKELSDRDVPRGARRAHRPARPPADHGGGPRGPRHAEGAARRDASRPTCRACPRPTWSPARDARLGLQAMDPRLPGRRVVREAGPC